MSLACLGNRVSTQSLAFSLALSGMKCSLPLPSQHSPAETMTCFANLDLSTKRQFSSISSFSGDQTQSFWRIQVKVLLISDKSADYVSVCQIKSKESILQEWLLKLKLCTDFTLKHRWRPKIKKLFLH